MDKIKVTSVLIVMALIGVSSGIVLASQSMAASTDDFTVEIGKTYTAGSPGTHILVNSVSYASGNVSPTSWNGLTFSIYDDSPTAIGIMWIGTPTSSGSQELTVTINGTVYHTVAYAVIKDTINLEQGRTYNTYKTYPTVGSTIQSTNATVSVASWNGLTFSASVDPSLDVYNFSYQGTPTSTGVKTIRASFEDGRAIYDITIVVNRSTYIVTINTNNSLYGTVDVNRITGLESGTAITVNGNQLTIGSTTVTATPAATTSEYYYTFVGWTNADGTITADRTITANFIQNAVGPALPESYDVRLSIGQTWSYTPTATPPSATLSISGNATSWITLSNGTVSGTVPNVDVLTTYQLVITATTTNPTQTATQTITFTVVPGLEGSASPNTLYLYSGGPIPNTASETISLTYDGFGTGTYTWSMVDDGGIGMTVSANGELGGTCAVAPTSSPITVTVRITGTVSGYTQTDDVTFNVVVVAKLVFTSNPLTDAVIS